MTPARPTPGAGAFSPDAASVDEATELGHALERQSPVLLAVARTLLRNETDARDLVQTTLEIAARKAGDLRDPAALRSWLLTIQIREAFRFRRRLARLIRLSPEVADISSTPGPDADVIALRAALPKLPPRARAAVVLHYLADLPVSEVARAMGITENTAKGHLKAGLARRRQRRILGGDAAAAIFVRPDMARQPGGSPQGKPLTTAAGRRIEKGALAGALRVSRRKNEPTARL